jgi:apolipoprotein N-acyltransferase
MNLNEFSDTALRLISTLVEKLENQIQFVNWGYVGFGIFGILFIWMVIDSVMGSQLSPLFVFVVMVFLLLFYLATRMVGDML